MRNFFIDLENVRSYGLEGVLLLKPDDKVYVFYSDNANTLTIPTIESLNGSPAAVKYIKTNYIGANAMDFQIVTLLGATIEQQKSGSFYIISHDNGFKSAVKFCEGYFTGYSIITGVYANILLALNSETKDDTKNPVQNTNADKGKNKRRKNKKSGGSADNNTEKDNSGIVNADVNADNQAAVNVNTAEVSEAVDVKPEDNKTNSNRKSRNRRKKQDNANTEQKSTEQMKNVQNNDVAAVPDMTASVAVKENNQTPVSAENAPVQNEKSKNRRRNNQKAVRKDTLKADADADISFSEDSTVIPDSVQKTENGNQKKTKNSKWNNRRDKKNSEVKSDVPAVPAGEKKLPEASGSDEPKSMKYVYNALSDYLSKSTIDMYAKKIDEGIRTSESRNELHEFFKKSYGTDEAEALFKVVASDFEEMKKHVTGK